MGRMVFVSTDLSLNGRIGDQCAHAPAPEPPVLTPGIGPQDLVRQGLDRLLA